MAVTCEVCGRQCRTRYNLAIHMNVHTGNKPHTCDACHKSFQQRWNLVTHVSRVHAGHKPFTCADCHRSFGYKTHFKAHVRTHFLAQLQVPEPVKDRLLHPHACDLCERSFETPRLLAEHMMAHTGGRPFVCDTCGKTFSTRKRVAEHILRHSSSTSRKGKEHKGKLRLKDPTPCEMCGKTVARYSMHKHLNRHTRNRVYPCLTCGREFLESGHRNIHNRTHTGSRPYVCEICGKAYTQAGNLSVHRRRSHGIKEKTENKARPKKTEQSKAKLKIRLSENSELRQATAKGNIDTVVNKDDGLKENEKNREEYGKIILQVVDESKASNVVQEYQILCEPTASDPPIAALLPSNLGVQETMDTSPPVDSLDEDSEAFNNLATEPHRGDNEVSFENIQTEEAASARGGHTIRDFVSLATQWIATRAQVTNRLEFQEKDVEGDNTTPEKRDNISEWSKESKQELWERIKSDIGDDKRVKRIVSKMREEKGDMTMRLIRRLSQIPINSVVERDATGSLTWKCWDCEWRFASRYLLLRHRLRHAPRHLHPFRCHLCPRTFTQAGNLQHHLLCHRGEHRFICESCGTLFRHKSHLKTHIRQHAGEGDVTRFHCATCGKGATTRQTLVEHIRTHTNERPYQCQVCGKLFSASSTYERHMRIHVATSYKCAVCEKTFSDKSSSLRHQATHDIRRRHACTCGRSFSQLFSLRRHTCAESGTPPTKTFECHICQKKFMNSAGLKRHSATHDTIRTLPCPHCELLLKTRETLRRHIARQHHSQQSRAT